MEFDLILNELSLQNPAPNEEIVRQRMSCLIKTIKAIKDQDVKVNLRTKNDFHTTILAPKYPLRFGIEQPSYFPVWYFAIVSVSNCKALAVVIQC